MSSKKGKEICNGITALKQIIQELEVSHGSFQLKETHQLEIMAKHNWSFQYDLPNSIQDV